MNESARRPLLLAGIVAAVYAVYAAVTWLREYLGIDFSAESIRDYVLDLGPFAPIFFVFIVAGRSMLGLPSQVVLIAAGLCFGTWLGALVGGAGLMLSGFALFATARYAGRDVIEKRLGPRARHILNFTSLNSGAVAFSLACGYPISPLSPLHAGAGWTPMPLSNFLIAAFFGGLIRSAVFAYFGNQLTQTSWTALLTPIFMLAIALAIPLGFPTGREWLYNVFTPPEIDEDPAEPSAD